MALRCLISRSPSFMASFSHLSSARTFASKSPSLPLLARPSPLLRLRPLVAAAGSGRSPAVHVRGAGGLRCFSTRPTTSSLNDPSPNWSNRPPKETILLDGCDFEHWLVVVEPPEEGKTRDEIIDSYIKTLAKVVGSEEEARMKIYSVSTKHYFAFGALVSEELSYKIKELPGVRWVLPDSYLDVKNKDYGARIKSAMSLLKWSGIIASSKGEPFINGQAVPYDPKYHEEWVRNNARANERSRRNDRPRNFDRSRNFERRRENMQNRDFQNRTPMPNMEFQNREGQNPMPSAGANVQGTPPPSSAGVPPPNVQYANRDTGTMPNPSYQGAPFQNQGPRDAGTMPNPSYQGAPFQSQGPSYQSNYAPPMHNPEFQNRGGPNPLPPSAPHVQGSTSPMPPSGGMPNRDVPPYAPQSGPSPQGMPSQNQEPTYQGNFVPPTHQSNFAPRFQNNYPPVRDGSGIPSGNTYQGDGNPYQRGGGPYQGAGSPYQGNQAGGGYPGGGNAYQVGGGAFQGGGSAPQPRDIPGRD